MSHDPNAYSTHLLGLVSPAWTLFNGPGRTVSGYVRPDRQTEVLTRAAQLVTAAILHTVSALPTLTLEELTRLLNRYQTPWRHLLKNPGEPPADPQLRHFITLDHKLRVLLSNAHADGEPWLETEGRGFLRRFARTLGEDDPTAASGWASGPLPPSKPSGGTPPF